MLTKKQRELLIFIHEHMKDDDIAPSFEEMKEALNLKSKSGIHRLITALVERGYIERLPHRARALRVVNLPQGYTGPTAAPQQQPVPIESASEISSDDLQSGVIAQTMTEQIPLYGRIAAGTPIEAIRDEGGTIDIPPFLLGRGDHYALEVDGDSMIKAGINDHDIVIIQKTDRVENGEIAVALVDNEDVTLKRFRKSGNKIILEPENDSYEPQMLEPDRVQIQGRLISLFRRY
jgi:repressor LexA